MVGPFDGVNPGRAFLPGENTMRLSWRTVKFFRCNTLLRYVEQRYGLTFGAVRGRRQPVKRFRQFIASTMKPSAIDRDVMPELIASSTVMRL